MPLALALSFPRSRSRSRIEESTPPPPPISETDLDRILKMIPTEVLAFYTAAVPIAAQVPWRLFPLVLFLVGLLLVPLVLYLDGQHTGQPARWSQYVMRTLAFAAWAIAISWPFSPWSTSESLSWLRSLAVLIVPLVGALVLRGDRPPTPT